MKHYKLVHPQFMNEQGVLFGGYLLKWIDEFSYVTASLEFPNNRFVTVSLDNVVFKEPIVLGSILCFDINQVKVGNTSLHYHIKVYDDRDSSRRGVILFETTIVFVNTDKEGVKQKVVR